MPDPLYGDVNATSPYWYGRLFALQTCLETLAAQAAVNTAVKTPDPVRPAIFGHFC